ncbi:Modulator of FtsH protease HflK [Alphaproteobacteria bacterium SO-S41]|nr:Modulator of FtsH protease HflK [Alphaproteobacteria bacterium SO-S41]
MPWQNNSGGPWGGGGKDGGGRGPWGQGGKGGGGGNDGKPPNLEDLIRKGQERMKQVMPSGGIGPRGLLLIALAVVIAWLATGIYTVEPDEQGIVKTFGAYSRQSGPGVGYHLPWPIETVDTPKVTRENQLNVGIRIDGDRSSDVIEESLMLTGDENIVDVDFTVFWVIRNAPEFLFNVEDVEGTIKAVAESAMREVIGRNNQQRILTEDREKIQREVLQLMQTTLDAYAAGVTIQRVQMQRVDPPQDVIAAFRDVQAARADAERVRNEAETYRNQIVPKAQGRAAKIKQEAEGYKSQTVAQAQGEAQRFLSVYEQYKLAPEVTRERIYLETMEKVLSGTNKIIVDDGSGKGVVQYLPLDQLKPKPPAEPEPETGSGTSTSPFGGR